MNLNFKKYHFARPTKIEILKFAKNVFDLEATLCFDIEDIARDVANKEIDKQMHRERVICSLEFILKSFISPKVGLRINVFGSKEFFNDVEALEKIKNQAPLECIFLPKIKSGEEIHKCSDILRSKKINVTDIIPIIENKKSFNDLEKIVDSSRKIINKLAFGHCDYNYDIKNFPFHHQESEKYWEWIDFIVSTIRDYKMKFINSPYLELNNDIYFLKMINRLKQRTNGNFGQITLTLNQLKLCSTYPNNPQLNSTIYTKNKHSCNREYIAKKIITEYEDYISKERSFSFNKEKGIIISPQEYLAANKYLSARNVFIAAKD